MLSNTCKYAIRSMVYLSVYGDGKKKIGIKEISEKLDIPSPFLGKIMQSLVKSELLNSTKGPRGGFTLGRPAEEIALMEVVAIIDGMDVFENCLVRTAKCSHTEPCGVHDNITALRKELGQFFEHQTIADLASEFRRDSTRVQI